MSSFKALKVRGNILFTPSLLVFASTLTLALTFYSFRLKPEPDNLSFIYLVISLLISIKAFIVTFAGVSKFWKRKKGAFTAITLLLGMFQISLAFAATEHLTNSSVPNNTILYFLIASILAIFQEFMETKAMIISWVNIGLFLLFNWLIFGSVGSGIEAPIGLLGGNTNSLSFESAIKKGF